MSQPTTTSNGSYASPLDIWCPVCKAKPGQKCRSPQGVIIKSHLQRMQDTGFLVPEPLLPVDPCPNCGQMDGLRHSVMTIKSWPVVGRTPEGVWICGPRLPDLSNSTDVVSSLIRCAACAKQFATMDLYKAGKMAYPLQSVEPKPGAPDQAIIDVDTQDGLLAWYLAKPVSVDTF